MNVKEALDAGVTVAMGCDGSCSSDGQDCRATWQEGTPRMEHDLVPCQSCLRLKVTLMLPFIVQHVELDW
eukprot:2130157-Amphidinium_carterae.1